MVVVAACVRDSCYEGVWGEAGQAFALIGEMGLVGYYRDGWFPV